MKKVLTISIAIFTTFLFSANIYAEDDIPYGKCEMTINSSKHTFDSPANATGDCNGRAFGFYVPETDTFGVMGGINYDIEYSGQEFEIGTPRGEYSRAIITIYTIREKPPEKKPDPEPKEDKKPKQKEDKKPKQKEDKNPKQKEEPKENKNDKPKNNDNKENTNNNKNVENSNTSKNTKPTSDTSTKAPSSNNNDKGTGSEKNTQQEDSSKNTNQNEVDKKDDEAPLEVEKDQDKDNESLETIENILEIDKQSKETNELALQDSYVKNESKNPEYKKRFKPFPIIVGVSMTITTVALLVYWFYSKGKV